ncbi:hypothetical protein [Mycobacterium sp. ACS4331]|uniref:hypothetical protein n=1 Tax=Mycobacterium sp. ACS4331 TaxID=1834121 RepID=UPI001E5C3AAE|nr:hypothetical protein [Mycobacterium sp. ACS4331]
MTNVDPAPTVPTESAEAQVRAEAAPVTSQADPGEAPAAAAGPVAAAAPDAAAPAAAAPAAADKRTWSMPKAPVTRQQADQMGRACIKAASALARVLAALARAGVRMARQMWRTIEAVPPALRLFVVTGVGMLLGVVGSIALQNAFGLICTVVVVPLCSITLGVLGHRWYAGLAGASAQRADTSVVSPIASDLQRSVEYVDKKLAVALTSMGSERHQQALIALFQAKTAVELTLGTENDSANPVDLAQASDDRALRPRIRVGSTSPLRESNSLAAS